MYQNKISLMPQDILEKDFKIDTRGYRLKEVDQFLDIIIGDYEQRTAYTYADTWIALNSNVVSEKQVIIVDDYADEATSGKNLGEVLDIILSKFSLLYPGFITINFNSK